MSFGSLGVGVGWVSRNGYIISLVVQCICDTHLVLLQEMIDEADRDGDGEINEAEFLRIMKKTSLY